MEVSIGVSGLEGTLVVPSRDLRQPALRMAGELKAAQDGSPLHNRAILDVTAFVVGEAFGLHTFDLSLPSDKDEREVIKESWEAATGIPYDILRDLSLIHARHRQLVLDGRRDIPVTFDKLPPDQRIGLLLARQTQNVERLLQSPEMSHWGDYERGLQDATTRWEKLSTS